MVKRTWGFVLLVLLAWVSPLLAVDFAAFKTDAAMDEWLRANSPTYARVAGEIKARKDIHGYRFASKDDVRRGLVLWSEGYIEIRLKRTLAGADRMTTLIFEMCNGSRHRDHQQVDLAAAKGVIRTQEEFGLAHEMIEYEALRIHREIVLELDARAGPLPKEFFFYVTPTPRSAKEYRLPDLYFYLKAQQESGHTQVYYKFFPSHKPAEAGRPASIPAK